MQTSEKQVLSEEIQYFTEASHWLQKALLETLSSELFHPQGLCYMQGLDTNAQKDSGKQNASLPLAVS